MKPSEPKHRLSQYSGYTNWGIGYDLFESFATYKRIPLFFNEPNSLAFVLARLLRWKRTWFFSPARFSINLEPKGWTVGRTELLSTAPWKLPVFPITIRVVHSR